MSIEERAEAYVKKTYPHYLLPHILERVYIAGASDQQALIDEQKITANTPPAELLKAYPTFEENAAHQSGFLIACEWKEARINELEEENSKLKELIQLHWVDESTKPRT